MWVTEANNMHKKHLPAGRKCIFRSATAPKLKVMFQTHTPDIRKYCIIFF